MAELYSVRMRAAQGGPHEKGGHHISGAERIVKLEEVGAIAQSLADRALHHSKGRADFINITVDLIPPEKITYIDCLKVEEHKTSSISESHQLATELLQGPHISEAAALKAISLLLIKFINFSAPLTFEASLGIAHESNQ